MTPESMPTLSYEHAFIKMLLTLAGLLLLVFLTFWMLKRLSKGRIGQLNLNRAIKVIERRPLSAKSVLYLVEVRGKQVLISESQFEVRALTTLSDNQVGNVGNVNNQPSVQQEKQVPQSDK